MLEGSTGHFDPKMVRVFQRCLDRFGRIFGGRFALTQAVENHRLNVAILILIEVVTAHHGFRFGGLFHCVQFLLGGPFGFRLQQLQFVFCFFGNYFEVSGSFGR